MISLKQFIIFINIVFLGINHIMLGFGQFCTTDSRFSATPFFTSNEISSNLNIEYKNATDYLGYNKELRLDLFYPDLSIDKLQYRPIIFLIHGGGFNKGSKEGMHFMAKEFAMRGFVSVSIGYRLGYDCTLNSFDKEKAIYRAQQDAISAVGYVLNYSELLKIDTNWIFLGGASAGAVTVFNTLYKSQLSWNNKIPNIEDELGSLFSDEKFKHRFNSIKGIMNSWGFVMKEDFLNSKFIPTISFHGLLDESVNVDSSNFIGCTDKYLVYGSRKIHETLSDSGICSDLTIDDDGYHGILQNTEGRIYRVSKACCFFKNIFCGECIISQNSGIVQLPCDIISTMEINGLENNYIPFPNPFTDDFKILNLKGNETFKLYSVFNKLIFKGNFISEIDFTNLPKGVYILEIILNQKSFRKKVIKS